MRILKLSDLPWTKFEPKKRRVFLRVDFNVPMNKSEVLDDFRIRKTIPTIEYLLDQKCIVTIAAHLGRPQKLSQDQRKTKLSLIPVAERLSGLLNRDVTFSEEVTGSGVRKLIQDAKPGQDVIMLENLRFDAREESNDQDFAEHLFMERQFYVNDAFGASHRAHASIDAVPSLTKYKSMGLLLQREYEVLDQVLNSPEKPQAAILGGAKIEDKIGVIEKLFDTCKTVCVGGRMGLSFLAARNVELGASKIEKESIQIAKRLMADAKKYGVELLFPVDGRCGTSIDADKAEIRELHSNSALAPEFSVFDIGPKTLEHWKKALSSAKTIVWNGPMGVFENPQFAEGTLGVVRFLKEHKSSIKSVVGGGETVSAVTQEGALDELFHVSTGGGAMLEFMEGKALPGLEVLKLREREISEINRRAVA